MQIRIGLTLATAALFGGILVTVPALAQSAPQQSLLVLSKHDHTLSIVDPATLKVIAHAPVGVDPHEVIASSDGKVAYVSCYPGHQIAEIDLATWKVLKLIDAGNRADGLAWAK